MYFREHLFLYVLNLYPSMHLLNSYSYLQKQKNTNISSIYCDVTYIHTNTQHSHTDKYYSLIIIFHSIIVLIHKFFIFKFIIINNKKMIQRLEKFVLFFLFIISFSFVFCLLRMLSDSLVAANLPSISIDIQQLRFINRSFDFFVFFSASISVVFG